MLNWSAIQIPAQSRTRSLLAVSISMVVLCVAVLWLSNRSFDRSFERIAPAFVPTIPMMGVGMVLAPMMILVVALVFALLLVKTPPRPYTAIVFVGLQLIVPVIDVSSWGCGVRLIIAMMLSLIAMAIEQYFRQSLRSYRIILGLAVTMVLSWYVWVVCVAASAMV